jgi:hyaluronoglucosaminidase
MTAKPPSSPELGIMAERISVPELGIIEAYFGRAWSWEARANVIDTLAPVGYRFLHYAPKIDAKLRRDWQTLHTAQQSTEIAQCAAHARTQAMRFGVGLTPYGAHLDFNADTKAALRAKLAHLDSIGIDDLAILFDDMRGDVADLADRQAQIVAFCLDHSKATRFFMCPSYYSNDPLLDRVFGARPHQYLETLGKIIDPAVAIYWTGEEVCSAEFSNGHLGDISAVLGRKLALWDNYPVNDGPRMSQFLHLRAFTGRPADAGDTVSHHAINPMSQPTLGCIPAHTLPMLYAQGREYRYGAAFSEAATAVCGADLAAQLLANLLTLQNSGLDRMEAKTKDRLRSTFATIDHAAARELLDWLDNGYAITGEMLQTQ